MANTVCMTFKRWITIIIEEASAAAIATRKKVTSIMEHKNKEREKIAQLMEERDGDNNKILDARAERDVDCKNIGELKKRYQPKIWTAK